MEYENAISRASAYEVIGGTSRAKVPQAKRTPRGGGKLKNHRPCADMHMQSPAGTVQSPSGDHAVPDRDRAVPSGDRAVPDGGHEVPGHVLAVQSAKRRAQRAWCEEFGGSSSEREQNEERREEAAQL